MRFHPEPCVSERCDHARRGFVRAGGALGAALVLPGLARAAQIHGLKGEVGVNGRPARRETAIKAGDRVTTAPGSEVIFVVGQDAFLLRASSDLQLQRAGGGDTALIGGLRMLTGALLAVFGQGPRRLSTATATIGIRGTGVYIEASAQQTYFCCCYGDVEVSDVKGKERRRIISGYHTPAMIYADPHAGRMMTDAKMKNHTDAEVIMLDRLVGRVSPLVLHQQRLDEAAAQTRRDAQVEVRPVPAQPAAQPIPARPVPAEAAPPPAAAPQSPAPAPADLEWHLPPPPLPPR